jgi:FkbM family methyltransferase
MDPLSFYYEYKNIFESKIYHFNSTTRSPFIIDAGGYIGMSVLYFKSIYPDSKITVFEPDPDIFKILKKNVDFNVLKEITLINAGLGKIKGRIKYYRNGSDGGGLFRREGVEAIYVESFKLSDYLNEPVDMLKMNIEGMEGDVFEEIEHQLCLIKEIIFEYHCFHNLAQKLGDILTILDRNGFRYVLRDANDFKIPVPFQIKRDYRFFNLIYAKNINIS